MVSWKIRDSLKGSRNHQEIEPTETCASRRKRKIMDFIWLRSIVGSAVKRRHHLIRRLPGDVTLFALKPPLFDHLKAISVYIRFYHPLKSLFISVRLKPLSNEHSSRVFTFCKRNHSQMSH